MVDVLTSRTIRSAPFLILNKRSRLLALWLCVLILDCFDAICFGALILKITTTVIHLLLHEFFKFFDLRQTLLSVFCLFVWGCRIQRLYLCREVRLPIECHDIKKSYGEVPVMLELWGMRNTPSLPSFPGPLCPWVVAPDWVLSEGQIKLNCVGWNMALLMFKLSTYVKLNCLK